MSHGVVLSVTGTLDNMKRIMQLAVVPAVAIAALVGCAASKTPAHAQSATACQNTMAGPVTSSGDVISAGGQPFVSHGVTVSGLEHKNYPHFLADDHAQITSAHNDWCANTIRLQISQAQIVANKPAYRAAVQSEVRQAVDLQMAVVINDQTQWDTAHADVVTAATHTFWADMTTRYKTYKRVIFDMLNEPTYPDATSWQAAFKPLAQQIRAASPNMIWAEGYSGAQTLAGVGPSHYLGVSNTGYAVHHPSGAHTPAQWNTDYGYLQAQGRPVVDDEWTNWSANRPECWADAPTAVPAYIAWMKLHNIGYDIWALGWDGSSNTDYPTAYSGSAVLSQGGYGNPVAFQPNWSCTTGLHQGAGELIMEDFHS